MGMVAEKAGQRRRGRFCIFTCFLPDLPGPFILRQIPVPFVGLKHEFGTGVFVNRKGAAANYPSTAPSSASSATTVIPPGRFRVEGVEPAEVKLGVCGHHTAVFYEGPKLQRTLLDLVHVQPYEKNLPEKYYRSDVSPNKYLAKSKNPNVNRREVDEELLKREILDEYFAHFCGELKIGDSFCPADRWWITGRAAG